MGISSGVVCSVKCSCFNTNCFTITALRDCGFCWEWCRRCSHHGTIITIIIITIITNCSCCHIFWISMRRSRRRIIAIRLTIIRIRSVHTLQWLLYFSIVTTAVPVIVYNIYYCCLFKLNAFQFCVVKV